MIVKLSSIGDVVHAMPAVAALRRAFPTARLTWVVERVAAPLLLGAPGLDEVIVLDTRGWRRQWYRREVFRQAADCLARLRRHPVDVALDFQGLMKSAAVAWYSRARRRIGFATDALREPPGRLAYTEQVTVSPSEHVIRANLRLVEALGVAPPETYEFWLPPLEDEAAYVAGQLSRQGITGRFALLNPGGGWVTKRWPAANFGHLAELLWRQHGLASVVTYGPGEASLVEQVQAVVREAPVVSFPTNLREYLALAQRATVFVGGTRGRCIWQPPLGRRLSVCMGQRPLNGTARLRRPTRWLVSMWHVVRTAIAVPVSSISAWTLRFPWWHRPLETASAPCPDRGKSGGRFLFLGDWPVLRCVPKAGCLVRIQKRQEMTFGKG
ncbi:glycosyltransferase family 9 protein [Chloracidobacterium thermophilum]|nr:glycosyltransferase family 9 protein [Chloracidobacterium thermophilum]QUV77723.1 glycosyltransferase family 9 protein [Chloracidobacterium thermophilum]